MALHGDLIEHLPWRQTNREGVNGQRIMIVGYSHYYGKNDSDRKDLTLDVVRAVVAGKKLRFFTSIRNAFGFSDHADFWPRVTFFNFLPNCIGDQSEMRGIGRKEQTEAATKRAKYIISKYHPDKVFVFSTKGWRDFPCTVGECKPLVPGLAKPDWGEYHFKNRRVLACGFQHPERARSAEMKEQVKAFLAMS